MGVRVGCFGVEGGEGGGEGETEVAVELFFGGDVEDGAVFDVVVVGDGVAAGLGEERRESSAYLSSHTECGFGNIQFQLS